jgi:hypothetical protein
LGSIAALAWWLVALLAYWSLPGIPVWNDQQSIFLSAPFFSPYDRPGFVHPVWIVVLTYPFRLLPLFVTTLAQALVYFVALALVITKYGGGRRALLITLFSFFSMDAVIQLNVDWLVFVGLLLPVWASGPFVLAKPQIGVGYYLGLPIRESVKAAGALAMVVGITVLVWGWWPMQILDRVGEVSLGRVLNAAPANALGWFSIVFGVGLSMRAFLRRDVPLGILGWFFITPYIASYSFPLVLGMLAIRWPLMALILMIVTWVVYGGLSAYAILQII